MTEVRPRKTPGPDHPITTASSPAHVVVRSGGTVVAETDHALELREAQYPPVFYIPLEDVDTSLLRGSDHHTWCPYKGEASYYHLAADDGPILSDVVWYYGEPSPAVAEIAGHVAFYADKVDIAATGA